MKRLKYVSSVLTRPHILAFVLAMLAALILGLLSHLATELVKSKSSVEHTYHMLSRLAHLHSGIEQIETVRRGYSIAGQETYLLPSTMRKKK